MKKIQLFKSLSVLLSPFLFMGHASAAAANCFVVNHVQVNGLLRIKQDTVYSYLPLKMGQCVDADKSNQIIEDLYHAGFFSNISLQRQGDTLIINVVERPVISQINISGNKAIKTEDLTKALKSSGVALGLEYDPATLDEIKNVLLDQYFSQGKYAAQVDIQVQSLEMDRVALNVHILEGNEAKIKQIVVMGNKDFSEATLQAQFKLSSSNLMSFFTHNDVYSREKLTADLDGLRSFYLNHGYLHYQLDSSQVSISPDKQGVYVTASITEGPQYRVSGFTFSGDTILKQQQLVSLVSFKSGDIFSRQQVIDSEKAISTALGDLGYARADVEVEPKIDENNKTVALNFKVTPGERIYVRHINFVGNYQTNDNVLRRQMKQFEGGLSSTTLLNNSKRNLLQLPYIRGADMTEVPVPDKDNEEDVNYKVAEYPAASFNAGVGYSDVDGLLFNLSLNEKSFMGTGNSLNFGLMRSAVQSSYSIDYYNPYYTMSGIGREISLNYSNYNANNANIANYTTNNLGFSTNYNIPINDVMSYQLGYGYNNTILQIGNGPSTQLQNYMNKYGSHSYQALLNAGWTYTNLDRYILPTDGLTQLLGVTSTVPTSPRSLRYYLARYNVNSYYPLYKQSWLINSRAEAGFGNGYGNFAGNYPFFENFYAGGMGSVRGYEPNSLGPRDSNNNPLGGNMILDGSTGLVFPNPVGSSVRTTWFVDGGNVFESGARGDALGISGLALNTLRYSTGLEIDWVSPMGMTLNFALAKALNPGRNDDTQFFGFNVSAGTT